MLAIAIVAVVANAVEEPGPQRLALPRNPHATSSGHGLQAGSRDRMYRYGPALSADDVVNAAGANFIVTYVGFHPQARAAFQRSADLVASLISSPLPIRVLARFGPLAPGMLGQARSTATCPSANGMPNTVYAAALADKLNGAVSCAATAGAEYEITVDINSALTEWDFGTDGAPVSQRYNLLTVVMHELLHAIGFFGHVTASGGRGSFPPLPHIYDRFAETGGGFPLLAFPNPSFELGSQLISDDTYFDGPFAVRHNFGNRPKLDTHYFPAGDFGFLAGSSYSHLDDGLYSGAPNGLMTPSLDRSEVYTDPGPIVRGMLRDLGWGVLSTTQFLQQGSKLVGSGSAGQALQGHAVALSADGNTAIVGAPFDNSGQGAAWMWSRAGESWSQVGGKLVGAGAIGPMGPAANQGTAVAISADGNTAVVGGPNDGLVGNVGAAWVWRRSGGVWQQLGSKLVGSGGIFGQLQGTSVAISGDGSTILVGGPGDDGNMGAVWAWRRNGDGWTPEGAKLVPSDAVRTPQVGVAFGASVALSADGNTALVGGPRDSGRGAVWVWTRAGGVWRQQAKLADIDTGQVGTPPGVSVALSADGITAVTTARGGAQVWSRVQGAWTRQATLADPLYGPANGFVSMSANGARVLVGGMGMHSTPDGAILFAREGATWQPNGIKLAGTNPAPGTFVAASAIAPAAISGDGSTAILGRDIDNNATGAVWIFVAPPGDILAPAAPLGTSATARSLTHVDVTWVAVAGATSYQIERRSAGGAFSLVGTASSPSFADGTVSPGTAFAYRVRAVNAAGVSPAGAADVTTTILFQDDPLVPGTTARAAHVSQLRQAVNAARSLAGLSALTFPDPAVAGAVIRANHLVELRGAVDEVFGVLGLAQVPYADPSLAGQAIKAIHIQELRDRLR
jgi:hypothetical protein